MKIEIKHPFAPNSPVDEGDVRQIKKALNRLGYYKPYEKTGITGIPDTAVFKALEAFQKDLGLKVTGSMKPGDETTGKLGEEAEKTPEGEYIWRTVGDDKVRANHAELNRTRRSWADDPDPGEDFNCRCWAEPLKQADGLSQTVITDIHDSESKWTTGDFIHHFYQGGGREVTLQEMGYLTDVVTLCKKRLFKKLESQIADEMRAILKGRIEYNTSNSYPWLSEVKFELGGGTIETRTTGEVTQNGDLLSIQGIVMYDYSDVFTDPLSIRQKGKEKTSNPEGLDEDRIRNTDFYGDLFPIFGGWETEITGSVILEENNKKTS